MRKSILIVGIEHLVIVERMKPKWFVLASIAAIIILTILSFVVSPIFQFFLDVLIGFPFAFVCFFIAQKVSTRVKKAEKEELRREDDVLLQAVAFSQSIIFILLNLTETKYKFSLIYSVAIVTIAFYALRAWARIKDDSKYRYRSMVVFSFVCANSVTSIITLLFALPDRFYVFSLTSIYSGISMGVLFIASSVFGKRYDYEGHTFL